MGNPEVANVLKSGAWLYYAPVGETKPDESSVGYHEAWGGNWARVGYSLVPLALLYEDERHDIVVEEHLGAIGRRRIAEKASLETTLAELTAEYLQLAAADQDDVTETAAGATQRAYEETGLGDEPVMQEYAWGFEGMYLDTSGDSFPVRVFVHKGTARINGPITFSQKSTETTGIPILIEALTDPSQAQGQRVLLWQRVTAAASGS